jgi:hypothetical protein
LNSAFTLRRLYPVLCGWSASPRSGVRWREYR